MPDPAPTSPSTVAYSHANDRARQARLARIAQRLGGDRVLFLLARLLYRLRLEGQANIPATGACLFACNHEASLTDALVYLTVRQRRPDVHVFGWQHLRDQRPLYDFLRHYGEADIADRYLPAYKGRGLSAMTLWRARGVLLQSGAVHVTAEGELTWDGRLQRPLSPGAGWLALRTGAPVVPIVSTGGYDVQPRWQLQKIRLTGRITIRIGQPFTVPFNPTEPLTEQALAAASQAIWEAMAALRPPGEREDPLG
jgi:1-acyl-sn-glycerol-3-phosphate acyltransferase